MAKMTIRFDDKVALVTGAGAGVGRCYALELARRGAAVVVNDLGGAIDGGAAKGGGVRPADAVVNEIKAAGGKAVADYNSVVDGDKVVQTAIDAFGKLDIVVSNAGILRDRSFMRMSKQDFDLVHQVHVSGPYSICKAAWPHMKKNKYGRIILVTSVNGLYGQRGQVNYSSAKSAQIGMGKSLAMEGKKDNIKVNIIAPGAGTRMTKTVMPGSIADEWLPEYAAPQVAVLAHESVPTTGMIYETGGGYMGAIKWQRVPGKYFNIDDDKPVFTAEDIVASWKEVVDFSKSVDPEHPKEIAAHPQLRGIMGKIKRKAAAKKAKAKL